MATKVTSRDFQREFGRYRTIAHREAVTITNYGRDDLVLLSVDEYEQLKRYAPTSMHVTEMPDEILELVKDQSIPPEGDEFNDEYQP